MSALIAKAIELHREHGSLPFWQCIELARDLPTQSARVRRQCERPQRLGEGLRARHRAVRSLEPGPRRGICAARRDSR